jgi:hypothetical protein
MNIAFLQTTLAKFGINEFGLETRQTHDNTPVCL